MESSAPLNDKNAYFFGLHNTGVETVSAKMSLIFWLTMQIVLKVHILKNIFQKVDKIAVQMPNNHLYNSKELRIGYNFLLIIPLLIFLIAKFLNKFLYYRVTHLKVPLLQRLVYRVYEVFGVILIIFTKYGL